MIYERIVIIGASSGIGEGLSRAFAKDGCRVGIMARREDLLLRLKDEYPDQFITHVCDINKDNRKTTSDR